MELIAIVLTLMLSVFLGLATARVLLGALLFYMAPRTTVEGVTRAGLV